MSVRNKHVINTIINTIISTAAVWYIGQKGLNSALQ